VGARPEASQIEPSNVRTVDLEAIDKNVLVALPELAKRAGGVCFHNASSWKNAFLKQYEKFSRFLRNELCSNHLRDFGLKKNSCFITNAYVARWPTAAFTISPIPRIGPTANWKPLTTRPTRLFSKSLICPLPDVLTK